jgi:hypothetical protein
LNTPTWKSSLRLAGGTRRKRTHQHESQVFVLLILDKKGREKNILVFDLSGVTFDVWPLPTCGF